MSNISSQPIKTMLERRETLLSGGDAPGKGGSPSKSPPPPSSPTPSSAPRAPRSVYREIMNLTLVSLGQDNIDLTAFDREYRRAFSRLPQRHEEMSRPCDRPPTATVAYCRKLFRELKL